MSHLFLRVLEKCGLQISSQAEKVCKEYLSTSVIFKKRINVILIGQRI